MNKELKNKLDTLVLEYETTNFIEQDPIQFPYRFKTQQEQEIVGFLASTFAYGNRKKIILAIENILNLIDNDPYNFTLNFSEKEFKLLKYFKYRFHKGEDLIELFIVLSKILKLYGSIGEFIKENHNKNDTNIKNTLIKINEFFNNNTSGKKEVKFFTPNPKTSACKRLCMYFRWMVRNGDVDVGLWDFIDKTQLIIPLDTHVHKVSKELGLTSLKTESWKMAEEITSNLKRFDANDPIKYDFAIFSAGINKIEV